MPKRAARTRTAQIADKLAALPGWYYEDGWIRRYYKTNGWPVTPCSSTPLRFVAEAANHHPDLSVTWARVGVKLQTHSAGGITDKDLALARQIEESSSGAPLRLRRSRATPKKFVQSGDRR